ncbi:MAG: GNAT family N-acetyltransferase [Alphaproteobacteria bacterium]|nr:MAG: GNAT family N-acetyltransferase [Alphaproteobacteria bacterium]
MIEVCETTWPPARSWNDGAWTFREGRGGGQRVSATTENWTATDADLPLAEREMRAMGQKCLFQIRPGDERLDALLEEHGYVVHDPVNIWAIDIARLTGEPLPRATVYADWPPLELARDIWRDGGVGPERLAVMERVTVEKSSILARAGDHPGGVGFVAIDDDIAMVHALHVLPAQRRKGVGRLLLRAAAKWAEARGARVLSLVVTQGNHAANPLYAGLGMSLVGHYHYRLKPEGS